MHTFTVNWQPWYPNLDPPYVVAIVALPEQDGLRLTTNIVGCEPDDVYIGMPVRVVFEDWDGVWLPFFEPDPTRRAATISSVHAARDAPRPAAVRTSSLERGPSSPASGSPRSGGASTAIRSS